MTTVKNLKWKSSPKHRYCECSEYIPENSRSASYIDTYLIGEDHYRERKVFVCEACGINKYGMEKPSAMPTTRSYDLFSEPATEEEKSYVSAMPHHQHGVDPTEIVDAIETNEPDGDNPPWV